MNRACGLNLCAIFLVASLIAGCTGLPSLENRSSSTADLNAGDTRLGRAIAPEVMAHPGKSGIYPLSDGRDAFAARAMLAHSAERTLDVQYYIWRNDMTGTLLFNALRRAADRGVRVRLLLDDNNTSGLDGPLAALDAHPKIAVRLFNPFVHRRMRALGYLTDFSRANRRMHNKSFTADSQVTVVGGRNVGDEYFGAAEDVLFADLDVMAIGPVVAEVSKDFDRYWNSDSSYPAHLLLEPVDRVATEALRTAASQLERNASALAYASALRNSTFVDKQMKGSLLLEWADTRMVSDDAAKGLGLAEPGALIVEKLRETMGEPATELDLVSPYFVPTEAGVHTFVAMARRGAKIRILTNALEATDVAAVHSGYAKHRKVDGSRVFIGSFNFDPRSAKLNTEMGFVIDSPMLADRISKAFDHRIPVDAYQVRMSADRKLYWIERGGAIAVGHDVEPGTSFGQRAAVWLLSLLPIDWLL
ncbi:phospholipase D family protein [Massilia sp. RP-1-19]|uniref:Phospholipase D family protein n=1 Tax=Massilia polaris TaxID=2728846 RepID=A0A848HMW4_9BURK|nr:phospholipase D family protein [Massilia polaris]NML59868.1 phospholipase D family protein [Massilia polaris]